MNDAKDTLAIRPEPYMLESLPAYLLRVAHANGYAGTQRVFRMDGRRKIDLSTLGPLLSSMRAAFHTSLLLESEQPSPNGARVWNLRRARYCPVCLRTGRHWNRA